MIKAAVVILNWNGKKYLEMFLGEVVMYSASDSCKVYVADNNSSDGSCDYIRKNHPDVKLIELDANYGFAGGYNKALEEIESEYYVLLNSDVKVSANWLKPVIEHLDHNAETAACQPKILSHNEPARFEYAGAAGGFMGNC